MPPADTVTKRVTDAIVKDSTCTGILTKHQQTAPFLMGEFSKAEILPLPVCGKYVRFPQAETQLWLGFSTFSVSTNDFQRSQTVQ